MVADFNMLKKEQRDRLLGYIAALIAMQEEKVNAEKPQ